jgi:putative PEP-CTERM system histidine kinase
MRLELLGLVGYGAAALAFAVLGALLGTRRRGDPIGTLLLIAVMGQAVWAAIMAAVMYGSTFAVALGPLAESARNLLWILFVIRLAVAGPARMAKNAPARPGGGTGSDTEASAGATGLQAASLTSGSPLTPSRTVVPLPGLDEPINRAGRQALIIAVVLATATAGTHLVSANPSIVFALRTLATVFGLVCLEQLYRNAHGTRWAIKFLALALLALFGFDLLMYSEAMLFSQLNAAWWIARGFANALLAPLIAVSAARNPQWKIDVGVSRKAVFHSAALTAAGGYLVLIAAGGYYVRWFGGEWGAVAQALLLFAALLGMAIVLMSGKARARLRVFVAKHFYSYRFDYREEWMRLTRLLASNETADLPQRAIRGLGRAVDSRSGAIWLESEGVFRFEGGLSWQAERVSIEADAPLARLMREHDWIVDIDALRAGERPPLGGDVQSALTLPPVIAGRAEAWLVVPLLIEQELIGFVLLDQPLAPQPFDWETRDLLRAAAHQIASHIGMQRALEKLIRAQQFESFNRMSAFVVHDLKNLVSQLALLTRNATRHRNNPEFQDDMLATVENVMERMQGLLLQLRAGTRPVEQPVPLKLADVLHAAVAARRGLRPEPRIEVLDAAVTAVAHRDRLERVIGHLVQNAAEACGPEGRIDLRLVREGARAVIEVRDNGCGMDEAFIRDRLFQPFESTKAHGMGIGAFESREYLREIGGALDVESAEGAGTLFRVRLPTANGSLNG